ncbi:NAD(P)/FAD-dependent oxidoreductase [Rhodovibrionaceae bacterium A322]
MQKVLIVGGGILGCFSAWFLRRLGFEGQLTVLEKDPSYQYCSTALSAASIRLQFATAINIQMSLYGVAFLRNITQHFGADADLGYREQGYLILGQEANRALRQAQLTQQQSLGAEIAFLNSQELAERFPLMAFQDVDFGTLGQTGEGWFDAWSLLTLARREARRLNVDFLEAEAARVVVEKDRVSGVVLTGGEVVPCDSLVMAAGAWSGRLMASAGIDVPVVPRKRSVFSFRAPVAAEGLPMLFDTSGIWMRPEGEGFIGGLEPPAEEDHDADGDFEPHHHLMESTFWPALAQRIPAMEQLRLERAWAGHYEVNTLDHNGIIGPHDGLGNLIFATGFSGHGVMHAPAIGRGVAELITTGSYQSLDLSPLSWNRIPAGQPLVESLVY